MFFPRLMPMWYVGICASISHYPHGPELLGYRCKSPDHTDVLLHGSIPALLQGPGDLWYFPPGIPHSLQATADDPDGSEFLLVSVPFSEQIIYGTRANCCLKQVFDDGAFSEDSTFLVCPYWAISSSVFLR